MESEIRVTLEFTPNPNTLKFVTNQNFLEKGAANFPSMEKAEPSPLAQKIFSIPGISGVLVGTNFITITKSPEGDWDVVAEEVPKAIETFIKSGQKIFIEGWSPVNLPSGPISEVEKKIREILDTEIRPAVAMDGGDITFDRFDKGIVYLHLQGACSSCPSSIATLKMGVETRIKEAVPEVTEVVQV